MMPPAPVPMAVIPMANPLFWMNQPETTVVKGMGPKAELPAPTIQTWPDITDDRAVHMCQ